MTTLEMLAELADQAAKVKDYSDSVALLEKLDALPTQADDVEAALSDLRNSLGAGDVLSPAGRVRYRKAVAAFAASIESPPSNLPPAQRDIWQVVKDAGHRMTTNEIIAALAEKFPDVEPSPGMVKRDLAELSRHGILPNRRDTQPPGYGLSNWR